MKKKKKVTKCSPLPTYSPSLSCSNEPEDDYDEDYYERTEMKKWLLEGVYWNRQGLIFFIMFLIWLMYLKELIAFISRINITFD